MDPLRFGRAVRALRHRRRLRQSDVGALSGVSKSTVGRIELGQIDGVAFGTLTSVARTLGARLNLDLSWNGEALDRLLDEAHAGIVDGVVERLRRCGWEVAVEVSFAIGGERGSIDVMALHRATASVLIGEVKSVVPDGQATMSTLDRKARLAPLIARDRGWPCTRVSRWLFVQDTRTARRRVETHRATWDAAFPTDRREALAWLADPRGPAPAALVFVSPAHGAGGNRPPVARHRIRRRSGSTRERVGGPEDGSDAHGTGG